MTGERKKEGIIPVTNVTNRNNIQNRIPVTLIKRINSTKFDFS